MFWKNEIYNNYDPMWTQLKINPGRVSPIFHTYLSVSSSFKSVIRSIMHNDVRLLFPSKLHHFGDNKSGERRWLKANRNFPEVWNFGLIVIYEVVLKVGWKRQCCPYCCLSFKIMRVYNKHKSLSDCINFGWWASETAYLPNIVSLTLMAIQISG